MSKQSIIKKINLEQNEASKKVDALKEKLFKEYDKEKELKNLVSKLENEPDGYEFDEGSFLNSYVSVDDDIISEHPYLDEYFSSNFHCYLVKVPGTRNEYTLQQSHGPAITVDWNHERNSYFVYDCEAGEKIIEKREDWMDETYVAAVIAQYQNKAGVFNDVVNIDSRYGQYDGHFNLSKHLKGLVENLDDVKGLQKIIDRYEEKAEEDEE
jgi:hypothetical protein